MSNSPRSFNLVRHFALVSLIAVAVVCAVFAVVLTHFVGQAILRHDAALTGEFIYNLVDTEAAHGGFAGRVTVGQVMDPHFDPSRYEVTQEMAAAVRAEFLSHLAMLPDVSLVKVYAPDRRVVWSTEREPVGLTDTDNPYLEEAFSKKLVVTHSFSSLDSWRKEHSNSSLNDREFFVEDYIPLQDTQNNVIAVVEIYKEPQSLRSTIEAGRTLVWGLTIASALVLYLSMFWIVRRADRLIRSQQKELVDSENLVVIGELSAAVAHGIRSPLAAIRSSAELALESDRPCLEKNIGDIIRQVDRLGTWIRDLLTFSTPLPGEAGESVDLDRVLRETAGNYQTQCRQQDIHVELPDDGEALPKISGNRAMVAQVLRSVFANAVEAMPTGGVLRASYDLPNGGRQVRLTIADTGCGMSAEQQRHLFKPFHTTKTRGLGIGLALAKRIMDRLAGSIEFESRPAAGTRVHLAFNRLEYAHG